MIAIYKKTFHILKIISYGAIGVMLVCTVLNVFGAKLASFAIDSINGDISILPFTLKSQDTVFLGSAGFEDSFLECIESKPEIQNMVTTEKGSSAVAVNLSAQSGKYADYKGTSVINNTNFDITNILYSDFTKPKIDKSQPSVLIYHTHTSEGYEGGGSVVDVGKKMCEEFEALGYKTIHITTVFDKGQFSGAYSRSLKEVEKVLEQNPSIKLVIDVHRDSITDSNGVDYIPLTTINDQQVAQVMLVCGTNQKGLKHDNWRQNFKFALNVSRKMGQDYPYLSRPVNLRADRFNTHLTNHTLLIEMGSEKNTLKQAELAAVYTARAIVDTIS